MWGKLTWTSNEQHTAGQLKYTQHGPDFQLKLLMLFATKSVNCQVAFRLATEMAEAGKFDDLVVRYIDSQGYIKYRFLQAKHTQFPGEKNTIVIKIADLASNDDSKPFSLQKYFVSYLNDITKEEFRDGEPEDFIICTNINFDLEPSTAKNIKRGTNEKKGRWKTYLTEKTDYDNVFNNIGGFKRYQFNKNQRIRDEIIRELKPIFKKSLEKNNLPADYIEKIGEFLDKLMFAIEQPSGLTLEQDIKDSIGKQFNLLSSDIIYNGFFKYMYDWMIHRTKSQGKKGQGSAHFLTSSEIQEFFNEGRRKIANLGLTSTYELCKREIEKFGLKFKDDIKTVKEVREFLCEKGSEKQILLLYTTSEFLSQIKVFQQLERHNTIILEEKYLLSLLDSHVDPAKAFSSSEIRNLVITKHSGSADDSLKKFYAIARNDPTKKIVLIIHPNQKSSIQRTFNDAHVKDLEDNNNTLDCLTPESQKKILQTKIMLFGEKSRLASLTKNDSKDDLYSAINGEALTSLIKGGDHIVGRKHTYAFSTYIDIPRSLTHRTMIDKKCLLENTYDIFAISGLKVIWDELDQLVPINKVRPIGEFADQRPNKDNEPIPLVLKNQKGQIIDPDLIEDGKPFQFIILGLAEKKDFETLCQLYKKHNRPIHWLKKQDQGLEWKASSGSLFSLRGYVLKTESETQVTQLTDSAIIAAEAGMGKSTLMTTYAMSKNSLWPIRINLKDYEIDIVNSKFHELDGVLNFLMSVMDPESSETNLIKNLLKYCLTQKGQVTLLLDGYDEVKDTHRQKVLLLLRILKSTQVKVLITTRSHAQSELEDALGLFAYSLAPISNEQQKEFLKKFWISNLQPTDKQKIDEFSKKIVNYFHHLNLLKETSLVGIVLQARMIAEIFLPKCKEYVKHEDFNPDEFQIRNISDLFKVFVEYQYARYFDEKIEICGKLGDQSRIALSRTYTKAHGYLSLKSLFPNDQLQGLFGIEKVSIEELQNIGLVKTLKNGGTADFLHPTYAEYFVADILVNALNKDENHPKYKAVYKFLLTHIFRDNNEVIYNFMEKKIEKASDNSLSSKWKKIKKCDLLDRTLIKVKLQSSKPSCNDMPTYEKSLKEMQQDVENCMNWTDRGYYYNGDKDVILIKKLFQNFLKETDTTFLRNTLVFCTKATGKSLYVKANHVFSNNICQAVLHYCDQVKEQNKTFLLSNTFKEDCLQAVSQTEELSRWMELLNKLTDSNMDTNETECHFKKLTDFLIPEHIETMGNLLNLINLYKLLDYFYPHIIKKVKSYVDFPKIRRIINSLQSIPWEQISNREMDLGGSLIIDILYHPNNIDETKSHINDIYKSESLAWLERQGVQISRTLETLTPEMAKKFNTIFHDTIDGGTRIYTERVLEGLIKPIVNKIAVQSLQQIDKLAFLKMLVYFVDFFVDSSAALPFTSEQVKITLDLTRNILSQCTFPIPTSVEYLLVLGKAGFKLIDANEEILVIDPAGDFQYKFSTGNIRQVVELIAWRRENPYGTRTEFEKKCYKVVDLRQHKPIGGLKRRGSYSSLKSKRFKTDEENAH